MLVTQNSISITPEDIRPGMALEEVIDLQFAAGSVPEITQSQYLAWREGVASANQSANSIIELRNGRVIHIHHEPLPDFGWVATHDDITEQRRWRMRCVDVICISTRSRTCLRDCACSTPMSR